MARVYQSGTLNTSSLVVPNLYVQIVQPQSLTLTGVSTGRIGIVGTAGWGPVNTPTVVGTMSDYLRNFGPKQATETDAGLAVDIAALQGASDFRVVRVTDGTDTASTATLSGVGIAAKYTGTAGNAITVALSAATSGSGFLLTVSHKTLGQFVYSGVDWPALKAAVVADVTAIISIVLPSTLPEIVAGTAVLAGGGDGGAPGTSAFVGLSAGSGTGMYALQAQGCAMALLHGLADPTSWTDQASFGLQEGVYLIATGPAGDTISNSVAAKAGAGLDSYAVKVMHGDWLWWQDDTNGLCLVPPQAFVAGCLAALTPAQSSLNKQLYGIVGSQRAGLSSGSATYSDAELEQLFDAGIDLICNPAPGGAYWAVRCGHNSSSQINLWGDNYTRMTNFLAETLVSGMGAYVGELINASLFGNIRASILGLLSGLVSQGILGTPDGSLPYAVVCDATNNTTARTALGYVQCDVQVQYQGINEKFIVNLQGGSSVTVSTSSGSV